jgi:hypothetical protein
MAQPSRKDNRSQIKPAMEKVELAKLAPLPAGATNAEREAYVKAHHDSSVHCKERHLVGAWYIGRELPRLKATLRLEGPRWNAFCEERFDFGDRQARDYIKIAEHFSSKADLTRLLKNADSIRQAVALATEEEEKKQATRSLGDTGRGCESGHLNAGRATRRQPKQNRRAGSADPVTPLPLADGIRAELRDAGQALRQIAEIDETAFRRLLKLIQKEFDVVKGKTAKKNAENQGKAA